MMNAIQKLSLLILLTAQCCLMAPNPTADYANSMELQENMYYLYWNYTTTDILIELQVKTTGWIGFGLSPNGGMDGADVIIAWIDANGKSNFTDRHIRGRDVIVDQVQNWMPILVTSKDGFLVAKFTRKIKICDKSNEDMDIPDGTPFVIFAYGTKFSSNGDIAYHDFRGTKSAQLTSSLNSKVDIDMSHVETVEYRVDYTLDPKYTTIYYCQLFKFPASWASVKRHLIQYETLYTPGTEPYFHHWVLNECSKEIETEYFKNNTFPEPTICVNNIDGPTKEWNPFYQYCQKISLVWAVGGAEIQNFPDDLAYPIGGSENETKYFFLEIHYNNPNNIPNIHDRSGFKLYVTQEYRKNELGILTVGTPESYHAMILPPKADEIDINYMCSKNCTNSFFDKMDQVNIFATMPHTHLTGREVYSTLVRDGQEIAYITKNKYYNFNYQTYNFLSSPLAFKKGDEIRVKCVYNTADKTDFILGGYSTSEEMCFVFIWYYPKSKTTNQCIDLINTNTWKQFLDELVKNGDLSYANITESDTLEISLGKNNPDLGKKFNDFYAKAERLHTCDYGDSGLLYKYQQEDIKPIQEPVCETNNNYYYLSLGSTSTPMASMAATTTIKSSTNSATNLNRNIAPLVILITLIKLIF